MRPSQRDSKGESAASRSLPKQKASLRERRSFSKFFNWPYPRFSFPFRGKKALSLASNPEEEPKPATSSHTRDYGYAPSIRTQSNDTSKSDDSGHKSLGIIQMRRPRARVLASKSPGDKSPRCEVSDLDATTIASPEPPAAVGQDTAVESLSSSSLKRKSLHGITETHKDIAGESNAEHQGQAANTPPADPSIRDFATLDHAFDAICLPRSPTRSTTTSDSAVTPQRHGSFGTGSTCSMDPGSMLSWTSGTSTPSLATSPSDSTYRDSFFQIGYRGSLDSHRLLARTGSIASVVGCNPSMPDLSEIAGNRPAYEHQATRCAHESNRVSFTSPSRTNSMLQQVLVNRYKQSHVGTTVGGKIHNPVHPQHSGDDSGTRNDGECTVKQNLGNSSSSLDEQSPSPTPMESQAQMVIHNDCDIGPPLKRKKTTISSAGAVFAVPPTLDEERVESFSESGSKVSEENGLLVDHHRDLLEADTLPAEPTADPIDTAAGVEASDSDQPKSFQFDDIVTQSSVYQRVTDRNSELLSPEPENTGNGEALNVTTGSDLSLSLAATSDDNSSGITDYSAMGWKDSDDPHTIQGLAVSVVYDIKRDMIRRVKAQLSELLSTSSHYTCQGGQAESSRNSQRSGQTESRPNSGLSAVARGKRPLRDGEDDGDFEDENNNDPSKRPKVSSDPINNSSKKRFACPYFRRNPEKHRQWPSCAGPGWFTVHRVKEHVYRRHKRQLACSRCFDVFESEGSLVGHSRKEPQCEKVDVPDELQGFDNDQERRLRSRKYPRGQSQEERWIGMYKILFPGDEESTIPEPYYDDESLSPWPSSNSDDFERYEQHLRQVLPELVLSHFKEIADHTVEGWIERVPGIIRDCQDDAFKLFREKYGTPRQRADRLSPSYQPTPPMQAEHYQPSSAQIQKDSHRRNDSAPDSLGDSGYRSDPPQSRLNSSAGLPPSSQATAPSTGFDSDPPLDTYVQDLVDSNLIQDGITPGIRGSDDIFDSNFAFLFPLPSTQASVPAIHVSGATEVAGGERYPDIHQSIPDVNNEMENHGEQWREWNGDPQQPIYPDGNGFDRRTSL